MQLPETIHSLQTRRFLLLLCVSVLSFMINLDANIVAVSPSAIAHADFAAVEWVVSAYTLTFACRVLPAALAGRYGRRRIMMLGLGVFTAASLFCGAAPSMAMLNSARALQGVGTALQPSASLAILSHDFRGVERARAFAFWGSVVGIAITLGPLAGGIVIGTLGWEWAFCINVPVGVGLIVLSLYAVRESADPHAAHVDVPEVVLFSGGEFALTPVLSAFAGARVLRAGLAAPPAEDTVPAAQAPGVVSSEACTSIE
jgi:MFS family permease